MFSPRHFAFVALGIALTTTGCGSAQNHDSIFSGITNSVQKTISPKTETQDELHKNITDALVLFNKAKSFRTETSIQTPQGELRAYLEYAKPDRFRGTIDVDKAATAEIIVVKDNVYMRVSGGGWADLTKKPSATTIANSLRSALNGELNVDELKKLTNANVTKTENTDSNCELYQTTTIGTNNAPTPINLCITADGYPRYVELTSPQGPLRLDYFDFNKVFLIEKPM